MPETPESGWGSIPDKDVEPKRSGLAAAMPAWFVRWAPPATLAAGLISLMVHLVIVAVAAVIYVGGAQAGGAGEGDGSGTVGVAVMTEAELGALQSAGLDADAPAVADAAAPLPGAETELSVTEVAGTGGEAGGISSGLGSMTSGMGAGDISGGLSAGGGSGGGAASFFGVEARGTRFAYIVDVSGSMDAGVGTGTLKRIDILKAELGKSLDALLENAYYFVSLFSSPPPKPLGGRLEWVQSSDSGKQFQRRTVPLIVAEGSTEPVDAFKMVFSLRPKPDAIYFMTDGEFNEEYALQIARFNAEWRIPIHCITFVSREGEKTMRKIAADSGGTYTHVAGPGG